MEFNEFTRIVKTFVDSPTDIEVSKGECVIQIRDELISISVTTREGELVVIENDSPMLAKKWIIERLARLSLLSERIVNLISEEPSFVVPSGLMLDDPQLAPDEEAIRVDSVVVKAIEILQRKPAGTSTVLYLTSDAGEGKSTTINQMARQQAIRYKAKGTDWLLVPIILGGRSFLRFDNVVVATLMNRFRFQLLYFDSFIELVKLGVIVPAFDGFEEIFVESESEALTAVGNLMKSLESSGSILISARKAFFEYQGLSAQAKIFDSISADSVLFARIGLNRWDKTQFIDYASKRNLLEPNTFYDLVRANLEDEQHPLLTRAFLVKSLLDLAVKTVDRTKLIQDLSKSTRDYFYKFINAIIIREAEEKWIDRSGDPPQPLISISQHHELLSAIAEEMWIQSTDFIKVELLREIAQIFGETRKMPVSKIRQIKERVTQHALLATTSTNRSTYSFDHDEFRNFFLGQSVGGYLLNQDDLNLRMLLRKGQLPVQSIQSATQRVLRANGSIASMIERLDRLSRLDGQASYARENCGAIIIGLIDNEKVGDITIRNILFPNGALRNRTIVNTKFSECLFQPTSLELTTLQDVVFDHCTFEGLELAESSNISNVKLIASEVASVIPLGRDYPVFDPLQVDGSLKKAHIQLEKPVSVEGTYIDHDELDEDLVLTERVFRIFMRTTQASETAMRTKAGTSANRFIDQILPELLKRNVLEQVTHSGAGQDRRFKLRVRREEFQGLLLQSKGKFESFLALCDHT